MRRLVLLIITLWWAVTAMGAITVGADRPALYLNQLRGKRVALYSNHTGRLADGRHTLDMLVDSGINVVTIFSPEHGFRGTADAGEHVRGGRDTRTGVAIRSLFGRERRQSLLAADSVDIIVTDIQDTGLRFYTYYITMLELMNRAAKRDFPFMVLDRPNPTAPMGVDGPVLEMQHASGVGRLPIPVLHGMTLGELAAMASGEGWLEDSLTSKLTVIPVDGYTRSMLYEPPVAPSPNLPQLHSILLYPSTCLFEGTVMSLGRGTEWPFEVYGHPKMKPSHGESFTFTPRSRPGATKPPLMGQRCVGRDLRHVPVDTLIARGMDLTYVIDAYDRMGRPSDFFTSFFTLLAGTETLRRQIESGMSAADIKASWQAGIAAFLDRRRPYLLYP